MNKELNKMSERRYMEVIPFDGYSANSACNNANLWLEANPTAKVVDSTLHFTSCEVYVLLTVSIPRSFKMNCYDENDRCVIFGGPRERTED